MKLIGTLYKSTSFPPSYIYYHNFLLRFKSLVSEYQKFNLKTSSSLNILNVLQALIIGSTMCIAMVLAARSVKQGSMSIGGTKQGVSMTAKLILC